MDSVMVRQSVQQRDCVKAILLVLRSDFPWDPQWAPSLESPWDQQLAPMSDLPSDHSLEQNLALQMEQRTGSVTGTSTARSMDCAKATQSEPMSVHSMVTSLVTQWDSSWDLLSDQQWDRSMDQS